VIVRLFWCFTVGICRNKVAHNEKVLWKLRNLKTFCPNVRLCKLLNFNYLQMNSQFPYADNKSTKNYQCSITSVRPHLPQYYVGGRFLLSVYAKTAMSFSIKVKVSFVLKFLSKFVSKRYNNIG
jgi:hypothetical protein